MAGGARQHVITVAWIDQNLGDMLGILQPNVGPVLAAVSGFVNAIADRDAVAHPRFAGAHPDDLRIGRINGDRTNRLHAFASKTGLKVVPPLTDFHTPPLAAPAKTVMRPFSSTASTAAMRPLIVAEPILRAGKPDTVAASNRYDACAEAKAAPNEIPASIIAIAKKLRADRFMVVSPSPEKLN